MSTGGGTYAPDGVRVWSSVAEIGKGTFEDTGKLWGVSREPTKEERNEVAKLLDPSHHSQEGSKVRMKFAPGRVDSVSSPGPYSTVPGVILALGTAGLQQSMDAGLAILPRLQTSSGGTGSASVHIPL